MKEQILKLREEGKTYTEIQEQLGCSRGTISYHCGKGQKEKTKLRTQKSRRSTKSKVLRKIDLFLSRREDKKLKYIPRTETHYLMLDKILNNPICYLTGRNINLDNSSSYNLDHIEPYSKTQDNSITNMGLSTKEANSCKSYLTVEEFINLCKEVLEYNGYEVNKK